MLGLRCAKHSLYNGSRPPADPCDACTMVHAANKASQYVADLERVQPIKLVNDLSGFSTKMILDELGKRFT
jgi:hypothetical protein